MNTATDALSTVMPFGSTILSVAKAASGEDVNAGDVGFAAMEIVPLGAVGKVAKGGNTVIKGFTRHAMEQAITRGFKTVDILRIVREGTSIQAAGRYGSQIRYTLGSNVVVVNAYGKVVTVFNDFSGSSKGINKGFFIPFK